MPSSEQADELKGDIYTALRHGHLDAEIVVELACFLEEEGVSTPATRQLLECPTALLSAADLTRLGKRLLSDTGFEPTFSLDPSLWVALEQALKVVEHDVRSAGTLRLVIPDWDDNGHARVEFRGRCHGNGIRPIEADQAQWALTSVADAAQEVIVETIWEMWPVCSAHNRGLRPELEHEIAVWRCTGAGSHTVARVGELPPG